MHSLPVFDIVIDIIARSQTTDEGFSYCLFILNRMVTKNPLYEMIDSLTEYHLVTQKLVQCLTIS